MAGFIEPGFLAEDELRYELMIRSMPPITTRSRLDTLRQRMIMESRREVVSPSLSSVLITDIDLKTCSDKLVEIEKLIVEAAEKGDEKSVNVLKSRVNHLNQRLKRYKSNDARVCNRLTYMIEKTDLYGEMLFQSGKDSLKEILKQSNLFTERCEGGSSDRVPTPSLKITTAQGAVHKDVRRLLPIPEDNFDSRSTRSDLGNPREDAGEDLSDLLNSIDLNDTDIVREMENIDFYEGDKGPRMNTMMAGSTPRYQPPRNKTTSPSNQTQPNICTQTNYKPNTVGSYVNDNSIRKVWTKPQFSNEPIQHRGILETRQTTNVQKQVRYDEDRNRYIPDTRDRPNPYETFVGNAPVRTHHNIEREYENRYYPEARYVPNRYDMYEPQGVGNDDYQYERPSRGYRNPIPSWRLTFDGDGSKVNTFLTQVYHMARADRVSADDLLESAIHLFVGNAREWYMAFSDSFRVWTDLTHALRREFIPHDSDFFILKQIEQRYQKKDEPFVVYLSRMVNLYNQLGEVVGPIRQVKQIKRNMLPSLARQLAIYDVRDLRELSRYVKMIEDVDESYKGRMESSRPFTANRVPTQRREISEVENTTQTETKNPNPRIPCWNCKENNHEFTNCTYPKMRVFCYDCGELGQLAKSCLICRQGNQYFDPANQEGRLESRRK